MGVEAVKMGGQVAMRIFLRRTQQATNPLWVSLEKLDGGSRTLCILMA